MTTIIIADGITATLTDRRVEQYYKAVEASETRRSALLFEESFDWAFYDELCNEEWEAWEKFFS